jgi:hypothetical protein
MFHVEHRHGPTDMDLRGPIEDGGQPPVRIPGFNRLDQRLHVSRGTSRMT